MTSRVNRRALLTAAPAAAVPAMLAAPAIAQTNPEVRWRLTSSFPRNTDILWGTAEAVAKRVGELTEGRFRIQAFPGGEIAPALAALDAVQSGSVECAHTASYYYHGKDPALAFFTAVPFGLNTRQNTAWLRYGGGQELMNEMMREYNAIARRHGLTPTQFALGFCYESWRVAATVIGVTTVAQLEENVAAFGTRLSPELLAEADAVRWRLRDPSQ